MLRGAVDLKRWALVSSLALACVPVANAQAPVAEPPTAVPPTTTSEPSLETQERARVAYARGQSAFSAAQYEAALVAFQEAFAAVPKPVVLLGVAEAQAKLGRVGQAIATLQQYLELAPTVPDRADIEAKINAWAAMPASVSVVSEPPGAELSVDGAATPTRTPAQLELAPGQHVLAYTLPGYEAGSETFVVEAGSRHELAINLRPSPPAALPPPVAVTAPAAPVEAESPTAALWITGCIGAAGLVTGTVLGFLALEQQSDFDAKPSEKIADRGERLALFSDVGFGIGVMALATTAVLYFTQDDALEPAPQARAPKRGSSARLQLIPQLSPTTASATARLRF